MQINELRRLDSRLLADLHQPGRFKCHERSTEERLVSGERHLSERAGAMARVGDGVPGMPRQGPGDAAQQSASDRKRIPELERELRRKDRALAETAALLVLTKTLGIYNGGADE